VGIAANAMIEFVFTTNLVVHKQPATNTKQMSSEKLQTKKTLPAGSVFQQVEYYLPT